MKHLLFLFSIIPLRILHIVSTPNYTKNFFKGFYHNISPPLQPVFLGLSNRQISRKLNFSLKNY